MSAREIQAAQPGFPFDDSPIVLLTDFGAVDSYVGVMKGVVLGINPRATIIDLSHQIQPQNILQAAFVLAASYRFFPPGSIHVVVVDPGVGTGRWPILLETPFGRFLAPDNGVLSQMLAPHVSTPPSTEVRLNLPRGFAAYHLTESKYWMQPVSHTFHGRDIFAPVAAHLSSGVQPDELGARLGNILWLPSPQAAVEGDEIRGEVIYVDGFGNLVTNIQADGLNPDAPAQVTIKGRRISGLSHTFHDPRFPADGTLRALVGSHGFLEIALPDGNAASEISAGVGEPVSLSGFHPS